MSEAQATVTLNVLGETVDNHPVRKFTLKHGSVMLVGRSSSTRSNKDRPAPGLSNAFFDTPVISRMHAEISFQEGKKTLFIEDMQSMHGTVVNGKKLLSRSPFTLNSGDVISIGSCIMSGRVSYPGRSFRVEYHIDSPKTPNRPPYESHRQAPWNPLLRAINSGIIIDLTAPVEPAIYVVPDSSSEEASAGDSSDSEMPDLFDDWGEVEPKSLEKSSKDAKGSDKASAGHADLLGGETQPKSHGKSSQDAQCSNKAAAGHEDLLKHDAALAVDHNFSQASQVPVETNSLTGCDEIQEISQDVSPENTMSCNERDEHENDEEKDREANRDASEKEKSPSKNPIIENKKKDATQSAESQGNYFLIAGADSSDATGVYGQPERSGTHDLHGLQGCLPTRVPPPSPNSSRPVPSTWNFADRCYPVHPEAVPRSIMQPDPQYHSYYPVHGISQGPYGPRERQSGRFEVFPPMRQTHPVTILDSVGPGSTVNPAMIHYSPSPTQRALKPVPNQSQEMLSSRYKVSISNIVDPVPTSNDSRVAGSKRKAAEISTADKQGHEMATAAAQPTPAASGSLPASATEAKCLKSQAEQVVVSDESVVAPTMLSSASQTSFTDNLIGGLVEPAPKKVRTSVYSSSSSIRPFMLGALMGGIGVLSALISLPDSLF